MRIASLHPLQCILQGFIDEVGVYLRRAFFPLNYRARNKTLTNTWDADKNRVGFSVGSTSHTFVYDTAAGIPAVVKEDGIYCVREPGGALLARVDGSNLSYYHFDGLGSTRLLTDASGNMTDRYDYDAYGAVIAHDRLTGSMEQPYHYVGRLGYYSHCQEPGFGLLQLGVRFYDAEPGRFSSMDPFRSSLVEYAYVDGRVLTDTDPSGLIKLGPPCGTLQNCLDRARATWLAAWNLCAAKHAACAKWGWIPGIGWICNARFTHCAGVAQTTYHAQVAACWMQYGAGP